MQWTYLLQQLINYWVHGVIILQPLNKMLDCDQSEWSLSSVDIPVQKNMDQDESSFAHTTLHEQYSYESKHPPQNKPILVPDIPLHPVGKVMSVVEDFVVIDSESRKVIDLETYLLNKNRQIVGYIVDVFGPVEHHFYALKQEDNHIEVGEQLFYVEGCRVLEKSDIQKLMEVGKVKDEDSEDEEDKKSGMFKKRERQAPGTEREDVGRKMRMHKETRPVHHQQWRPQFQPQMVFNQQAQYPPNMFFTPNNNQLGNTSLFGNQPNNQHLHQGYSTPQMNFNSLQVNIPQHPHYIPNQMQPQPFYPQNAEEMRRIEEYYKNCYQQMMPRQK